MLIDSDFSEVKQYSCGIVPNCDAVKKPLVCIIRNPYYSDFYYFNDLTTRLCSLYLLWFQKPKFLSKSCNVNNLEMVH